MNKEKIIKKSEIFTEIINKNNSIKNKYFSIYYEVSEQNLYGITVPKKIGKAHVRNKLKRQIKNIIIINEKNIQKNYKYVIIVKEAILELSYSAKEKELLTSLKKVGNINEKK